MSWVSPLCGYRRHSATVYPIFFNDLLNSTRQMTIASAIVSIWHSTATATAQGFADLAHTYSDRFILGLGASHAPRVDVNGRRSYARPYSRMVAYLDDLDAEHPPVPAGARVLAALGPRMLRLSAARSAGAHPYFVPVEHTAIARETLGPGPLLVPEQTVVLQSDPECARDIARRHMQRYLAWPNYTNNLRRLGWDDVDLAGSGSDTLVDAIVAWGDLGQITARARAHQEAGADTVSLQVLTSQLSQFPREQFRELASALF